MQISKEKKTEQKSKEKMLPLPLKLVRQAITHHPLLLSQNTHHRRRRSRRRDHHRRDLDEEEDDDSENDACNSKPSSYNFYHHSSKPTKPKSKTPFLLFLPTRELIGDTYRLANIAREMGLFKLVFITTDSDYDPKSDDARNWDCCSISLFSRRTGDRIESMQSFSRALTGMGWTLYSTRKNPSLDSLNTATKSVHLFRKVDSGRVRGGRGNGEHRTRELRLPSLDFRNAPLKILQYIVLMTDDVFYLG
ncbi:hypothetical protein E1A91_A05G413700v1 [Gossypium mustelinum]|uniref:Uncharacterized protein n=1 Tax=Gossypium mustelinum TaxID=34275 RepID=A0A5D2ZK76_GOSMU|nr:hypothetical protein E1A91_A05G413700v1 [Gossypium mustelinum]TYJ38006.1 hypothetical protein E1A91_A05G413700v1 [Gossypium mustelinum]TYJ38009.1 hypothetical protein E1A91_A05G413700v1 [Gossypium mustelinum]TYJ38011.1 hypothetical protein E1A91_A05G413700v1 [Gossypium mustelinum]TYJ38012.1 hypothetical protein E1A91_A05G413700v1 [Gossypium mustelinum]